MYHIVLAIIKNLKKHLRLEKIICLRKSEVFVERILVCNSIEKFGGAWHTPSAMLLYHRHHRYIIITMT